LPAKRRGGRLQPRDLIWASACLAAAIVAAWSGYSIERSAAMTRIEAAEKRSYNQGQEDLRAKINPLVRDAHTAAIALDVARYAHIGRRPDEPPLPKGAPQDFWVRVWAQRNALENLQRRLRSEIDGGFGLRVVEEQTRLARGESFESAHHVVLRNANTGKAYVVLVWQTEADRQDGKVRWAMTFSSMTSEGSDFGY
jgi:hypothetical protein